MHYIPPEGRAGASTSTAPSCDGPWGGVGGASATHHPPRDGPVVRAAGASASSHRTTIFRVWRLARLGSPVASDRRPPSLTRPTGSRRPSPVRVPQVRGPRRACTAQGRVQSRTDETPVWARAAVPCASTRNHATRARIRGRGQPRNSHFASDMRPTCATITT